ncbi:TPA: hypothetical protein HA259_07645 [Thermoplasmata archaeon]|nr:hypothetical protein [Thermoplasmata archaeon]
MTIDILDSGMAILDTKWCDATDEDGMYSVTFSSFTGDHEPEVGDTIRVTAKYLSEPPATNSTLVGSIPPTYIHYVNVTVDSIVIPEFGFGQGVGLPIVIIGIVAIFIVVSRKRAA